MKKKKQNKFKVFILVFVLIALAVLSGVVFMTSTRPGLRMMTNKFIADFIPAEDVTYGDVSGQLSDELVFRQIELKNLKWFPENTVIRIQRLAIRLNSLNPKDAEIDFENIRVFMPYSDPIVISGNYRLGNIACNIYSSNISIEEILTLVPRKLSSNPKGVIKDIDLYLEGPPQEATVKGTFNIAELVMPKFTISDAPGDLSLVFRRVETGYAPSGMLQVSRGKVTTKTAVLKLDRSMLTFNGSFAEPAFDIKGTSAIGKTDIDVALLGTPKTPQWKFNSNSNPPIQEEVLMLMFLTGKNLEGVQASVDEKRLTPDLAKDMVDYFLFNGEGGRLAQRLGIKDISIIYEKETATTGIGVKKEVTDFLDLGYQVEQKGVDSQTSDLKHTLGADLKLNKHFSVQVDKELYQYHNQERLSEPVKTDDKILLKYKTWF
jgi:autotransporter translocation and assembly factor TamB